MTAQQIGSQRDPHRRQHWRSTTPLSNFSTSIITSIFDSAPFFALLARLASYCLAFMFAITIANLIFTDNYGLQELLATTLVYMSSGLAVYKLQSLATIEAHDTCASRSTKALKLPGKADLTEDIPVDYKPFTVYVSTRRGDPKAKEPAQGPASSSSSSKAKDKGKGKGKAASDSDGYEDQPAVTVPKKRVAKGTLVRDVAPKQMRLSQETPATAHGLDFDDLGITRDESTAQINKIHELVVDEGLRANPDVPCNYTPRLDEEPRHVLDLPLYDPDHRQIRLMEEAVDLYDHPMRDGTTMRAWKLQVEDLCNPSASPVPLFVVESRQSDFARCGPCALNVDKGCDNRRPVCNRCNKRGKDAECREDRATRGTLPGTNLITAQVCGDKQTVIELGRIAADVMNRAPMDLELEKWRPYLAKAFRGGSTREEYAKTFVETTSLVRWKERYFHSLDLGTLPKVQRLTSNGLQSISPWVGTVYNAVQDFRMRDKQVRTTVVHGVWQTEAPHEGKYGHLSEVLFISPLELDVAAVEGFHLLDGLHIFGDLLTDTPSDSTLDLTDRNIRAAIKAGQIISLQSVGLVGSSAGLQNWFFEKRRSLSDINITTARARLKGPLNGHALWNRPRINKYKAAAAGFDLELNASALPGLHYYAGQSAAIVQTRDKIMAEQVHLGLHTTIRDGVCIAFVMQSSIDALARGEDLLHCMFGAFVTAQYITHGLLVRSDILDQYCSCHDHETRKAREHVCTVCFQLFICSSMVKEDTGNGLQLKCKGCAGRISSSVRGWDVRERLLYGLKKIHTKDSALAAAAWTVDEMLELILQKHGRDDPAAWLDEYTGMVVSLADAVWPLRGVMGPGGPHPNAMSIEKPHSRWLRDDLEVVLHDPANITLIKDSVNRLKGCLSPSAMALMKKAIELKKRVEQQGPSQGYRPEVRSEWRTLERAQDNQRVISVLTSLSQERRVAAGQGVDTVRAVIAMETTGIWDGKTLEITPSLRKNGVFYTRGQQYSAKKDENDSRLYTRWTTKQWQQLQDFVAQVEEDTGPHGLNPYQLKMPKLGKTPVFWPWRYNTCPADVDSDYFFDEFEARLNTMDNLCDRYHVTDESPATMFAEYMVQWYQTGGKCHFFGFEMVPYAGHFASYSFGRGLRQRMDDSGNNMRNTKPGDHMKTGCTDLLPTDVKTHYDVKRRTVVCESWRANVMRFKYLGKPDVLLPILEQSILDLCDETAWYHPVQSIEAYADIPLPTSYKTSAEWVRTFVPPEDVEDLTSTMDGQDEVAVDEEVEVLQDGITEAQAAQVESSDQQPSDEQDEPSDKQWVQPATHVEADAWAAEQQEFFDGIDVPEDKKAEFQERIRRLIGLSKTSLVHDINDKESAET